MSYLDFDFDRHPMPRATKARIHMRIERIAAGMADINDCVLRYSPPVTTKRWSAGKLAWQMAVFVIGMGGLACLLIVAGA